MNRSYYYILLLHYYIHYHIATNINKFFLYLVDKGATVKSGYLAPSNIRYFEVRVQQKIEAESVVLAGIVNTDVEMELLLPQY